MDGFHSHSYSKLIFPNYKRMNFKSIRQIPIGEKHLNIQRREPYLKCNSWWDIFKDITLAHRCKDNEMGLRSLFHWLCTHARTKQKPKNKTPKSNTTFEFFLSTRLLKRMEWLDFRREIAVREPFQHWCKRHKPMKWMFNNHRRSSQFGFSFLRFQTWTKTSLFGVK